MAHPQKAHFHIQWDERSSLDWECFRSAEEARNIAKYWVYPGRTFTIHRDGENCACCAGRRREQEERVTPVQD